MSGEFRGNRIKRVREGQSGEDEGNFDCVMEVQERVAGNFDIEIEALGKTFSYEIWMLLEFLCVCVSVYV